MNSPLLRRLARAAAFLVTFTAFATFAPAALADGVSISMSSGPYEEGIPLTVTLSGSAGAIDDDGDGAYLFAVARPSSGVGCQQSFGADQVAAGDASTVLIDGDQQTPDQPFTEQAEFTPDIGGSIVCAWLESDGDDGDDIATPDEVTAGPISATFTSSAPQVGPLKVSVPAKVNVGAGYEITYSTQSDQDLGLYSVVIPAGGDGCAASYEAEIASDDTFNDVFGGSSDVYGAQSTVGDDSESAAGQYVICSWIEGPDDQQVEATSSVDVTIGTSAATSTTSGASSAKSSASTKSCTVPKSSGANLAAEKKRLIAAHCSVGTIRRVRSKIKAGGVIKLSAAAGKILKAGSAVSITVSIG